MNEPSENLVTFRVGSFSYQLVVDNKDLVEIYEKKLNMCLTKLQAFPSFTTQGKIDQKIFYDLAQALIIRFDELVNSLGQLDMKGFSLILDDVANNFLQAAMIGLSRIQIDWEVVCKIAFKDKNIPLKDCRLSGIKFMSADPHNDGQVPWQCEITCLRDGKKSTFFYKPSPVIIDMLLNGNTRALHELNIGHIVCEKYKVSNIPQSFAEITHEPTHLANLTSYIIVPMKDRGLADPAKIFDHYGYMEFLIADGKHNLAEYNLEQHHRYSTQAGKVAATALICGMPDFHYDNLIISGQIYVIDVENSSMPAIPNPEMTQLFRAGLGGFYGDYQNKPNRFFFIMNNKIQQYFILEQQFMTGAHQLFQTLDRRYETICQWLEHPLFLQAPLRVIPLATKDFYELRRDVLEQRMNGRSPEEIRLLNLENFILQEEVSQLKKTPHDTYADTEMQSVILMGNNIKFLVNCLYKGDIPTYYMLASNRTLLNFTGRPAIMPACLEPINYFLHIPGQAFHDRVQIIRHFSIYRETLLNSLQYHLLCINDFLGKNKESGILEIKRTALQETANRLYKLIDYICVLSYLNLSISSENPDKNLINMVLSLKEILSSITREMMAEVAKEIKMTTTDISILMKRADEMLEHLQGRYREGVALAGQQYALYGKIPYTYKSLLLLQKSLEQEHIILQSSNAVKPPTSIVTPHTSEKKEPDKGADPLNPSTTHKRT